MEKYTESQMNWMIRKGYAWPEGQLSEWDWKQPLYTRDGVYCWVPPCVKNGNIVDGFYEKVG